jgi:UDP-glucose 4-epimerase
MIVEQLPYQVEIKYSRGTPGDTYGIIGNSELAKHVLHWTPQTTLEKGLTAMVDWSHRLGQAKE